MSEREFDVVVLGSGPAGEVCAGRLGEAGLEVAAVESHLLGGECSFYACMPSKALLRPGELLAEVRRIPGVREAVRGDLDAGAVLARRDEIIHDLDDSNQVPWLEQRGVTVVRGPGRIDGARRVRVGEDTLVARKAVVVATGTAPLIPPIDGLREAEPWTNREATTAKEVPDRLAILGGGVVAVEMAQAYSSLGSQVTVIERADRLIAREEPFASEHVLEALRENGVDVRLGTSATAVRAGNGEVTLELDDGGPVRADQLLVAIGRRHNTDDLGLDTIGLEPGKPIHVDDSMRTEAADWLFAIGDVNGRALLTHMGKYQARIAADVILGHGGACLPTTADGSRSPRVIFTDPHVAAVGYTLDAAKQDGLSVRAVDVSTQGNAGASFYGRDDARGNTRLVVDDDRGVIVGATFTGPEVAEFLHAATIAVVGEVPLTRLFHAVPAFPTRSEVWLYLLEALGIAGPCGGPPRA
ncbi:MAG TPA: NAD(P)/FAD-dependent oxidoreductase [Thermoleophilaceae bacterium]|nr:NAD(P)/FAD-dependent oxidoreductase [Thermoleophilaceae bacterium]